MPGTPITGNPNEYAFGALRCATDNLNGDNVEWIAYPAGGVNHVFCFAYYVMPAPTSGTIVVEKQIVAPVGTLPQRFRFTGNISYATETPGGPGVFYLTAANGNPALDVVHPGGRKRRGTSRSRCPLGGRSTRRPARPRRARPP